MQESINSLLLKISTSRLGHYDNLSLVGLPGPIFEKVELFSGNTLLFRVVSLKFYPKIRMHFKRLKSKNNMDLVIFFSLILRTVNVICVALVMTISAFK